MSTDPVSAAPTRRRWLAGAVASSSALIGEAGVAWWLPAGAAAAAPVSSAASRIDQDWAQRLGDDAAWATAAITPGAWQAINLGIAWDRQGVRADPVAWLRKDVEIDPAAADDWRLVLNLGAAQVDAFCNGQALGRATHEGGLAELAIPPAALRADGRQQLALRVAQHWPTGGRADDLVQLRPRRAVAPDTRVTVQLAPADHCFGVDTEPTFDVEVTGDAAAPLLLNAALSSDLRIPLGEWSATVRPVPQGRAPHRQRFTLGRLPPGFYQVVLRHEQAGWHGQQVVWFAVAPERLGRRPQPPRDFDAYWARALRELAAVPAHARRRPEPARSSAAHQVHTLEMASVEGVTLRAWLVVPAGPTPARGRPAVLHLPGYSEGLQPERFMQDDGLVHLALDIRGHGRSADVFNPGFGLPGFLGHQLRNPERYVYRNAYLDCLRALEVLLAQPEVDRRRVAVAGGSQGGGLAFATAALAPGQVAACVAGVPYLGDFQEHLRVRDIYRGEMQACVAADPLLSWPQVERTMGLVDTMNLAPRIRCPVLMGTGLLDDDCPSRIGFSVFNVISAPKTRLVYPDRWHDLGPRWAAASAAWLQQQLAPARA